MEFKALNSKYTFMQHFCGSLVFPGVGGGKFLYTTEIVVNRKMINALIDTCNMATGITCIHGDVKYYPTTIVEIVFKEQVYTVRVGVIPRLPHKVILGRDFPGLKYLEQMV